MSICQQIKDAESLELSHQVASQCRVLQESQSW